MMTLWTDSACAQGTTPVVILAELMGMDPLSPQVIEAEVKRFWSIFISKKPELLEDFYDPEAIVFSSSATRSEPGRLTVVRRRRENSGPSPRLTHGLGKIDAQGIGQQPPAASY